MEIAASIQSIQQKHSDNVSDTSCTKNNIETIENCREKLEKELLKRRPDHFVIIDLCRSFTTSIPEELRAVVWKELLGVSRTERLYLDQSIARVEEDLANQKVIMADALRTRANDSDFFTSKKKETIEMIVKILTYYCKCRNICYKQGMNEVLAPFLMLSKETPLPEGIIFQCFYALIDKFLPHVFSDKEFKSLQCSFQLYRLLLLYHDPMLCHHLDQHDMTPELYVTPWFMTLFARNLPALIVFVLWDLFILENDPYMLHFVAVAIVKSHREEIMTTDIVMLPQVLSSITFKTIEMVRTIFDQAKKLVKNTPRSFRKDLHAACFGGYTNAMLPYLRQLSFASCLGMYPNELVSNLMGRIITTHNDEDGLTHKNNDMAALSTFSSSRSSIFFIVLDCRPLQQYALCHLSLSYHIDPEIVSSPDALEVLMAGFSKMKGCHFVFLGPSETFRTKRQITQSAAIHTLNKFTRGISTDKIGDTPAAMTTATLSPQAQGIFMHEEHVYVTRLVLMFLQKGFEHVSTLYGGFDALKKEILTQNTFTQEQLLVQDSGNGLESGSAAKVLKSLAKTKELFERVRSISEEDALKFKTKATVSNLSRTFQNLKMVAKDTVQQNSSTDSGSQVQQMSTKENQVVNEDEWVEVCVKTQQALEKNRKEEIVKEVVFEEGSMGILFQNAASKRLKKYAMLVESLAPGGQAMRSQQIEPGDALVAVNGQNIADVSFVSIIEMMKDSPRPIVLSFSTKKRIESLDLLSIPPVAPSLLTASNHSLCISWTQIAIPNACYHLQYTKRSEYNYNPWKNVTMKNMMTGEIDSFGVTTHTNGTMVGLDPGISFVFRVRCGNGDRWGPYSLSSVAMSTLNKGDDEMHDRSKNDSPTNSNSLSLTQAIFLPGECPEFFEKGTFYFKVLLGLRARSAPFFNAEKLEIILEKDNIIKCTERLVIPGTNQIFVKLDDDVTAWAFENTPEGAVVLQRLPDEEEANELLILQEQRQQQQNQNQIGQQAKTLMTNLLNASGIKHGGVNTTSNINPPAAPMVFAVSPTSLVVTWDPINDVNVTKYQIQFAKHRLTAMWHTVKDELNADTIKYVIEGLPPNTAYTVRIRGGSDDAWGPYSDTSPVCKTEVQEEKLLDHLKIDGKKSDESGNNEVNFTREPSFLEKAVAAASRMSKRATFVGEDQRDIPKDVDREELLRRETESNAGVRFVDLEKWKTSKEPVFQDFHFFKAVKIFLDDKKELSIMDSSVPTFVRELVVTSDMLLVLDPTKFKSNKGFASIEDQRLLQSLLKITSKKALKSSIVFHFKASSTQTISTNSNSHEVDQLIFIIDDKSSLDACLSVVMRNFKDLEVDTDSSL